MTPSNKEEYDMFYRISFLKSLQTITNKIHATDNVQQIMLELSDAIRDQFGAEHLTLYVVSESKLAIETTVKTGLRSFKDFSLPISGASIAGYVALTKKLVNIRNAYDAEELESYTPKLQFKSKVDARTGYRTREILAGAIVNNLTGELLGVLQIINTRDQQPFSEMLEEGMQLICETLAVAIEKRLKPPIAIRCKYDPLVVNGIISAPELALATSAARRKGLDLETVLIEDFQIKLSDIGEALSEYFGVDYLSFLSNRTRPVALKSFKRAFVERHGWLVLEVQGDSLLLMSTDPSNHFETDIIKNFFPQAKLEFCVATKRDFYQTVETFYQESSDEENDPDAESDADFSLGMASIAEKKLSERVQKTIAVAFDDTAADIHIKQQVRREKNATIFRKNSTIKRISGQIILDYHVNFPDVKLPEKT